MAGLSHKVKPLLQICARNWVVQRNITKAPTLLAQWHHDWELGKKPETQAEKEAAAKKYGLLPEDYQVTTDPTDTSDYPELPRVGQKGLDPYTEWDDPALCRNYGEPLHKNWEQMTEDRADPSFKPKFSFGQMLGTFLGFVSFMVVTYMALEPYRYRFPRLAKQYPWGDDVKKAVYERQAHYTFEPAK